eukprot:7673508-Pyramimonas_sp.AAC.1
MATLEDAVLRSTSKTRGPIETTPDDYTRDRDSIKKKRKGTHVNLQQLLRSSSIDQWLGLRPACESVREDAECRVPERSPGLSVVETGAHAAGNSEHQGLGVHEY